MADIDFGQLSEALNDKADTDLRNVDTTAKADAVIDYQLPTAENGYTWYRKYKSGWVEQGGIATVTTNGTDTIVTMPVEMSNTKYTIVAGKSAGDTAGVGFNIEPSTTTTFKAGVAYGSNLTRDFGWQVSGKSAN